MQNDKEEFLRRRKGVRNEADMTAQQLINIYRQLGVLGEDATARYNEQLLRQVNADILTSFKTIPGGEEVRDYYNFLTHKDTQSEDKDVSSNNDLDDLLPQPEEISPLWMSYQMPQMVNMPAPMPSAAVTAVPASASVSAVPQEQTTVFTPQQKEVSVITKTVEVKVGFDEQKVKQGFSTLLNEQKEAFSKAFQGIIIDSNIEVMNANLKQASKQIMESLEKMSTQIGNILAESKVDGTPVVVSQTEETKKKPLSASSIKNVRRKSEHKFSVDMSEEE